MGVRELARALGMPSSSYNDYERTYKKRYQPVELMQAVAEQIVGKGEPPIARAEVMALAGADGSPSTVVPIRSTKAGLKAPPGYVVAKEVEAEAWSGNGALADVVGSEELEVLSEWMVPRDFLPADRRNAEITIIRVRGRSMEPMLRAGDRIMVDVSQTWVDDDATYVAWNGTGVVIKNLQAIPGKPPRIKFSSENPAFEAYQLPADEVRVFGRVLGRWVWM